MILTDPAIRSRFSRRLRVRELNSFLRQACAAAKLRGAVSVLLTGDARIRELNSRFRRKDKATDVLSFPAPAMEGEEIAGDLAISVETAAQQAGERGHSLAVELQVLVLHGVLHLAGYDHETDTGEMARKEAALRKRLGLAAGLIERSGAPRRRSAPSPSAKRRSERS